MNHRYTASTFLFLHLFIFENFILVICQNKEVSPTSYCWNGASEDSFGLTESDSKRNWVSVSGSGCRKCSIGEACSFLVEFQSDMFFEETMTGNRDFIVILAGPSLINAYISPYYKGFFSTKKAFMVSYQCWDEGEYTVKITVECAPNGPNYHLSLSLATFSLLVEVVQNGSPIPCDFGLLGRWIRLNSSTHVYNKDQLDERLPSFVSRENFYTFQYYSCNGKPVEINEFSFTLLQRGIREVSFVGDSHLRSVFLHMQSLIDGGFPYAGLHSNREWHIYDSRRNDTLTFKFYFVKGVYRNGELGCPDHGGMKTWQPFSNSSDVVVLSAASWSFLECEDAAKAFASHLPEFLSYYTSIPKKNSTKFLWRPIPPFPRQEFKCHKKSKHKSVGNLAWANQFSRNLLPLYNVQYLNFRHIEAPRYLETCYKEAFPGHWVKDTHYSCFYNNYTKVYGTVGEAVARAMMHFLTLV